MSENKKLNLNDGANTADETNYNKRVSNDGCCGYCRLNGKPATGNGQNENREGKQVLSEVME